MPTTRKATTTTGGAKTQQSKLTDAFKTAGTRITKPSAAAVAGKNAISSKSPSLETPPTLKKSDSVTLLAGSPPPPTFAQKPAVVDLVDDEQHEDEEEESKQPEIGKKRETLEAVVIPKGKEKVEEKKKEKEEEKDEEKEEEVDEESKEFLETVIERPIALPVQVPHEQELAARKITEKQIKAYGKQLEDARMAPTVHQQDLPLHETILRHFDLSSQYGPCIGITRFKRWNRAYRVGLNPPVEVLAVLIKEELGEGGDEDKEVDVRKVVAKGGRGGETKSVKEKEKVGVMAYVNDLLVTKVDD